MSLIKFIFSKTFVIQLVLAVIIFVVICFLGLWYLNISTNHDQRIAVPDLSRLTLDEVDVQLDELDLRREILESANYNPDYPRYSVIDQSPDAGKFVKENRKIYLTLNPSGYGKIEIPNLIRRTKRQVEPTLRALGFQVGDITYKDDIAKDAVLELRHNGSKVEPGDLLMKTSTIDLILGNGSGRYNGNVNSIDDSQDTNDDSGQDDGGEQ